MSEKTMEQGDIQSQEQLSSDVYSMWIKCEKIAAKAKPGQFVNVYMQDGSGLLPRPISICEIDENGGRIRLVYRVVGKGTTEFTALRSGDTIRLVGPLGNGFPMHEAGDKVALLVGGGVGVPPLLEVAKRLEQPSLIVLGYRDEVFLADEFRQYGQVYIATEDGSQGVSGNVLDAIREENIPGDMIFACGPKPMLKALKKYIEEEELDGYFSLEERMACGIGACLACVCETTKTDEHTHVDNVRVCVEGPVFHVSEVIL